MKIEERSGRSDRDSESMREEGVVSSSSCVKWPCQATRVGGAAEVEDSSTTPITSHSSNPSGLRTKQPSFHPGRQERKGGGCQEMAKSFLAGYITDSRTLLPLTSGFARSSNTVRKTEMRI